MDQQLVVIAVLPEFCHCVKILLESSRFLDGICFCCQFLQLFLNLFEVVVRVHILTPGSCPQKLQAIKLCSSESTSYSQKCVFAFIFFVPPKFFHIPEIARRFSYGFERSAFARTKALSWNPDARITKK